MTEKTQYMNDCICMYAMKYSPVYTADGILCYNGLLYVLSLQVTYHKKIHGTNGKNTMNFC